MRYLFVLLLAGCASSFNATLVPRGGGQPLEGLFDSVAAKMAVTFDGAIYVGGVVRGRSSGAAVSINPGGAPVTTVANSASNQYASTMLGPKGAMRCEFTMSHDGGNGTCLGPDTRTYDLVLQEK